MENKTMGRPRMVDKVSKWDELVDMYGTNLCFYCNSEIATSIDHVVPYSWDQDNSIENLVLSCMLCNVLASNIHFDNVYDKRDYIINKRRKRGGKHSVCPDCLLPLPYNRTYCPSIFLCPECYDAEYGTKFSIKQSWIKWIKVLETAGVFTTPHRELRKAGISKRIDKLKYIEMEYEKIRNANYRFESDLCLL